MDRGVDLSTITRAERWVFGIGVVSFVNAMVPWWYRIQTTRATYWHNAGLYGYGLIAALAAFAAAGLVVVRHARVPAMFNDRYTYVALGVVATVAMIAQIFAGTARFAGLWVGLALAAGQTVAGVSRVRERRRGWV